MKAVKTNQEELYLPGIVTLGFLFRWLMSSEWRDPCGHLFGIGTSMDDFKGQRRIK